MWWTTLGTAALLSCNCANAVSFPRAVSGKGYLSVPVGTIDKPKEEKSKRQDDTIITQLENKGFFYATDIEIGTPPQRITVLVDTGSNELWVNPDCTTTPSRSQARQCRLFGEYDPGKSETPAFGPFGRRTIRYGGSTDSSTQTSVTIRYYTDDIAFGDSEIKNQTFGIADVSDGISQGILGLAPDLRAGVDGEMPYSLVLSSMAEQGLINSRVFALDLRHAESETGAVIYGGLDRNKFIGDLEAVDIIPGEKGEYRLAVRLTSLGIAFEDDAQEFDLDRDDTNVMLDSGTTLTRMHYTAALPILEALRAEEVENGLYVTRCTNRDIDGGIDFGFGNKIVRVPFSDFILNLGSDTWCFIGIAITTNQQILGDSVLRAGYFVFDWDNEAVHVAQAANCGEDDIVAVGSGPDAVPKVSGNCKESDAKISRLPGPRTSGGSEATRTAGPIRATVTVTAGPSADNKEEDSAAWQNVPMGVVFAVLGGFALGANLI